MLFVNVICEYKTDTETFTDTFFQNQRLFLCSPKNKKMPDTMKYQAFVNIHFFAVLVSDLCGGL